MPPCVKVALAQEDLLTRPTVSGLTLTLIYAILSIENFLTLPEKGSINVVGLGWVSISKLVAVLKR